MLLHDKFFKDCNGFYQYYCLLFVSYKRTAYGFHTEKSNETKVLMFSLFGKCGHVTMFCPNREEWRCYFELQNLFLGCEDYFVHCI